MQNICTAGMENHSKYVLLTLMDPVTGDFLVTFTANASTAASGKNLAPSLQIPNSPWYRGRAAVISLLRIL